MSNKFYIYEAYDKTTGDLDEEVEFDTLEEAMDSLEDAEWKYIGKPDGRRTWKAETFSGCGYDILVREFTK